MGRRPNVFVLSGYFLPYVGSASIDLHKRIKYTNCDYSVVHLPDFTTVKAPTLLDTSGKAKIERVELERDLFSYIKTKERYVSDCCRVFRELHEKRPFNVILSHSEPMLSHVAALDLKKTTGLKWVAKFGDVAKNNPYFMNPDVHDKTYYRWESALQDEVVKTADVILCNNDYQCDLMLRGMESYRGKFVVVPHCIDPAGYSDVDVAGDSFVISHVGALYDRWRSGEAFFRAIDHLFIIYPAYRRNVKIRLVGRHYGSRLQEVIGGVSDLIEIVEQTDYRSALRYMKESSALLLVDTVFDDDKPYDFCPFFPAKMADYLGARKPIIPICMGKSTIADLCDKLNIAHTDGRKLEKLAYIIKRTFDGKNIADYSAADFLDVSRVSVQMEELFAS